MDAHIRDITAAIVDLDGTLVDTLGDFDVALNAMLDELGLPPVDREAIRTMVGRGNTVSVQAGAGIVADSNPTTEYQETVNKASAMLRAIDAAESQG